MQICILSLKTDITVILGLLTNRTCSLGACVWGLLKIYFLFSLRLLGQRLTSIREGHSFFPFVLRIRLHELNEQRLENYHFVRNISLVTLYYHHDLIVSFMFKVTSKAKWLVTFWKLAFFPDERRRRRGSDVDSINPLVSAVKRHYGICKLGTELLCLCYIILTLKRLRCSRICLDGWLVQSWSFRCMKFNVLCMHWLKVSFATIIRSVRIYKPRSLVSRFTCVSGMVADTYHKSFWHTR